jgi:hypothetical protein
MIKIAQTRFIATPEGFISRFSINSKEFLLIELPWNDNAVGKSCIPVGVYHCKRVPSTKNRKVGLSHAFDIQNVPGRYRIRFGHVANWPSELRGCSGAGLYYDELSACVCESVKAVRQYMGMLDGVDEFELTITDTTGTDYGRWK